MSRRAVTTVTLQVRLRIPPGSNTAAVMEYVRSAIQSERGNYEAADPLASIDRESMVVKLEKKETTYL